MGRYTGPKSRKSRRAGIRLFPKDEKILAKRNFAPGMHGQTGNRRISEYGQHQMEKQKAKWMYGVMERQFRKYYERAAKKPGQTDVLLLQYLEARLDNVVYRLGLAQTRPQARQMVGHGFIQVNGKKVNIPSYEVKIGDTVAVKPSKTDSKLIQIQKAQSAKYTPPEWLQLDLKNSSGKVLSMPNREQMEGIINPQLIIEHYSR